MAEPAGVAMDASGNLIVSDNYNNDVRIVAASSGTLAGQSVTASTTSTVSPASGSLLRSHELRRADGRRLE
jgi:hypothetical protein